MFHNRFSNLVCAAMFFVCQPLFLQAQQLPYQTQFRQFYSYINPAAVSSDYFLYEYNASINASYRMQWALQPQTPRTVHLSGDYVYNARGRNSFNLATGAMLLRDRVGPLGLTGVYGRVASLFSRDPYFGAFSAGFSFGMTQYRLLSDRIVWDDYTDPNIPLQDVSTTKPEIGLGVYYFKRFRSGALDGDNIYAGISVPQLWAANVDVKGGINPATSEENEVAFSRVPHLYVTAGWYHFFSEDAFLELSLWGKYVRNATPNIHLTARFQPFRTFWVGGGFNPNGLAHLETGFNLPDFLAEDGNLKIGYAFDYNLTALDLPFGASHELNLTYMLDTGSKKWRR